MSEGSDITFFTGQVVSTEEAILRVLCYYNIFDHPLTIDEIQNNLSPGIKQSELSSCMKDLQAQNLIGASSGFFYLRERDASIVRERREKEMRAQQVMKRARFFSKLIGAFPYVEGVCISGSLSKGVLEKKGDVDFFIITKPRRLWICRSLLILFKKTILLNSRRYFCINYFVDKDHLFIPDHNIFTATEISSLMPMVNKDAHADFLAANSWIKDFLPNAKAGKENMCKPLYRNILRRSAEFLLKGQFGERCDNYFFRLTLRRWKKKFAHFNPNDFDLNLRSRKTVSKHHPRGYQQKVLDLYFEKCRSLSLKTKPETAEVELP